MTEPTLWNQLLIWPIVNLLIGFYKFFSVLKITGAFGWAIISLTVLVRLIIAPLTNTQLKSAQKIQQLKPRLDELQKKYQQDKTKLQQAQMELYQQAGINPVMGCLPLILQLPIFISVYRVFIMLLDTNINQKLIEQINHILYSPLLYIQELNPNFLGINLTTKPSQWQSAGTWLIIVPVITGLLQYWQSKQLMPQTSVVSKSDSEPDQAQAMQRQMGLVMPVMVGVFAFSFPIGLSLYWNSLTIFGIMQQLWMQRRPRT